ncbi:hypothetical protein EDB85DRAFT_1902904 [Lactarius pseudohatsudake]|nr:hypothetical protein EDB85DRAFT_1902904 [Lactarius pseudohatsudake]
MWHYAREERTHAISSAHTTPQSHIGYVAHFFVPQRVGLGFREGSEAERSEAERAVCKRKGSLNQPPLRLSGNKCEGNGGNNVGVNGKERESYAAPCKKRRSHSWSSKSYLLWGGDKWTKETERSKMTIGINQSRTWQPDRCGAPGGFPFPEPAKGAKSVTTLSTSALPPPRIDRRCRDLVQRQSEIGAYCKSWVRLGFRV